MIRIVIQMAKMICGTGGVMKGTPQQVYGNGWMVIQVMQQACDTGGIVRKVAQEVCGGIRIMTE